MKRFAWCLCAVCLLSFMAVNPNSAFAASMNNCTVTQTATSTTGSVWIVVTYNSTSYTLIMPSSAPQLNTFLATALTAMSSGKTVNLVVGQVANWATINSIALNNS